MVEASGVSRSSIAWPVFHMRVYICSHCFSSCKLAASALAGLSPALVCYGPHNRPDGQQRADDRFDIGGLDITLGDQRGARDGQDLADEGKDCRF